MNFPTITDFEKVEQFNNVQKWIEIPQMIYEILETKSVKGKYGISYIAKLKNKDGEQLNVWLPQRIGNDVVETGVPCFIKHDGITPNPKDATKYYHKYAILPSTPIQKSSLTFLEKDYVFDIKNRN